MTARKIHGVGTSCVRYALLELNIRVSSFKKNQTTVFGFEIIDLNSFKVFQEEVNKFQGCKSAPTRIV